MAQTAVEQILDRIDRLSESERLLLERRLAERAEAQWLTEVTAARELARTRGIDQNGIDRAIEQTRYPTHRDGE